MAKCIKLGNNNVVAMNLNELPDKVFITAIQVKDICKLRLVAINERRNNNIEPGAPDVRVESVIHGVKMYHRREIRNNFVHTNGKKIIFAYLKNNISYLVYRECNQQFKVMQIPINCKTAILNGKKAPAGSYVVAPLNEQGKIDRGAMRIVSRQLFKKSFRIPMQDIINKYKGSKNKIFGVGLRQGLVNRNKPVIQGYPGGQPGQTEQVRHINTMQEQQNRQGISVKLQKQVLNKPVVNNVQVEESKYKYTVINKVVDINNKLLGYTIKEIATGKSQPVNMVQLKVLCEKKLVDNVTLVVIENTGQKYFRGNGIVLNNLPQVIA